MGRRLCQDTPSIAKLNFNSIPIPRELDPRFKFNFDSEFKLISSLRADFEIDSLLSSLVSVLIYLSPRSYEGRGSFEYSTFFKIIKIIFVEPFQFVLSVDSHD